MLLPLASSAFDGNRKGFVIGFGAGFSPVAHWSRNGDDRSESRTAISFSLPIGYAWDNHNILVYEPPPAFFRSTEFNDAGTMQGVWAIRWYHYFGPPGRALFSTVGIGRSVFSVGCEKAGGGNIYATGLGFMAGGGYAFFWHLQAGLYVSTGWGSDDGFDYSHTTVSMMLTVLAY
jgi:hypothetical protein